MSSRLFVLVALLICSALACGDASSPGDSPDEAAGDRGAQAQVVSVDGEAGEDQALEGRLAGRVFGSPLRKSALAMVSNVEALRLRPWGIAFLEQCETRLRAEVLGMRGLDETRRAERMTLERHRLKAPYAPGARVLDFVSGEAGQRWSAAIHPLSPGGQLEGIIAIRSEELGLPGRDVRKLLVVSSELPSVAELAKAKSQGAVAWAVESAEAQDSTPDSAPPQVYRDPPGFSGEVLPLPLLFIDANTGTIICRRSGAGGFQIQLRIEDGQSKEIPSEVLVMSLRAPTSKGRIVVTAARQALSLGPGSSSLAAANLISLARALASVIGDAKRPRDLALDVDIVFVADGKTGFDFLSEVPGRGALYGVIDLGDLVPESPQSTDLLVSLGGIEGRLEDAAIKAAGAYARRPAQAWDRFGLTAAAGAPGALVAEALGQDRIPLVRIEMARLQSERSFEWFPGAESAPRALEYAPPAMAPCRGPSDTFRAVAREKLAPHIAAARLALIAIIRTQAGLGDS